MIHYQVSQANIYYLYYYTIYFGVLISVTWTACCKKRETIPMCVATVRFVFPKLKIIITPQEE